MDNPEVEPPRGPRSPGCLVQVAALVVCGIILSAMYQMMMHVFFGR